MSDRALPESDEDGNSGTGLGNFYIGFTILWSGALFALALCTRSERRQPPYPTRMSGTALGAVIMLRVYWMVYMLEYPLGNGYACSLEFWIMSITLPYGVALFQASNIQVLRQAILRQRLAELNPATAPPADQIPARTLLGFHLHRFPNITTGRMITLGMILQLIITIVLAAVTGKVGGGYGEGSEDVSRMQCRQGLEWLPAIIWPASIGLPISWAPPMWFVPGVMMMEFVTICFPKYTPIKKQPSEWSSFGRNIENMSDNTNNKGKYSIASLEEALANDISPLLHFATNKDFSGENIMFLNHIRNWKAAWPEESSSSEIPQNEELYRHLFNLGVEIYATFVNINTAQLAINIESPIQQELTNMFGQAAKLIDLPGTPNVITPFDTPSTPVHGDSFSLNSVSRPSTSNTSEGGTAPTSTSEESTTYNHDDILIRGLQNIITLKPRVPSDLEIPNDFGPSVFDAAEHSIKMLVLRGTWPKYIDAMEEAAGERSEGEGSKKKSLFSRFKK
ncbi:hypothetical protein FQN54_008682 [Arachnomyces sp. PD_36]|nr:hypothetical protein FQN54_008682 [Arachnomyces sp. PD_36]